MVERLAGAEAKLYHQALAVIRVHRHRNQLRENLFLAKKRLDKIGFSVPDSMKDFDAAIGWPEKAVMIPARRIKPQPFTSVKAAALADELNARFDTQYTRLIERMAIDSSLKHGASFAFVTAGDLIDDGTDVVLSARSALEGTALIDRRTLRVRAALELIDRATSIFYLPGETLVIKLAGSELVVDNRVRGIEDTVPCVPFAWGRTLDRPFGRSRITRPVIDLSGMAVRIMLRQEVHAEHFSSPQRALEGAREAAFKDKDGRTKDAWEITTGGVWGIPDFFDEETGEWRRANLKQIAASSMQPHTEHLRSIAMMYSGETGIPVDQLGIIHDNPGSADAIRAHDAPLNDLVSGELPNYEEDRHRLATLVMQTAEGDSVALRQDLRRVKAPFQDPGTTTPSGASDRAVKFLSANPWAAESDVALEMWGFDDSQLERLRDERDRSRGGSTLQTLLATGPAEGVTPVPAGTSELERMQVLRQQAEALGILRRAGVTADSAASLTGLSGVAFVEGDQVTIRARESDANAS